nr:TIM barrel protein [Acidaminobacter sp. JC074]
MGFNKIELNYAITKEMIEEILPMVDKGQVEISSVHHPFPKHSEKLFDTDSQMLGFEDKILRNKAIDMTKQSIDYAHLLGAKAVVIHPSEVPIDYENHHYDVLLKNLYREGKKNSKDYKNLYKEMIEHRDHFSPSFVRRTADSLEVLSDYILKKNYDVKIGIENRAMCHQIPDFYEAEYILSRLEDAPVRFWYDIGHGVMMENLGMFNNMDGLQKILSRTIGIHIHDVIGVNDHYAPYEFGDYIDMYLPFIKKIPIKVLEIGALRSKENVITAAKRIDTYLKES